MLNYDFVIVGAGIMGLLTAYELAHTHARILIIDQQHAGRESSWAGGGILSPLQPWTLPNALEPLLHDSFIRYPLLIEQLYKSSGIDPEYLICGLLSLNSEINNHSIEWAQTMPKTVRWEAKILSSELLQKNYPHINTNAFQQGLLLPTIAQVRNPRLLQSLLKTLSTFPNITLLENQTVQPLQPSTQRKITQLTTVQEKINCDQVILCSGAWSAPLLQPLLGYALPIKPVLGQMLVMHPKKFLFNSIILHKDHYLIPRKDGRILVGSTLENCQFKKTTTASAKEKLFSIAQYICPELAHASIEAQWAGLRPYAPEGIPYIGRLSDYDNVWMNAGHFRNGLTLAPASSGLLADLLLNRKPKLDPTPYDPNRNHQG